MAGKLSDADRLPMLMKRTPGGLSPVDAFDTERLDKYALGATVEVRVHQRRSTQHHRLYWAVLSRVSENCEQFPKAELLHDALKRHLGYVKRVQTITGEVCFIPDSTAFAAMDQSEFNAFFDRAMQVIAEFVIPGVDPIALVKEVERDVRS